MPEAKTLASSSTDDKRWTKHLRMFLAAHDVNELSAAAVAFQEETLNDGATFSGLSGWFKARWHRQAEESTRRVLERLRVSEHEDLVEAEMVGDESLRVDLPPHRASHGRWQPCPSSAQTSSHPSISNRPR